MRRLALVVALATLAQKRDAAPAPLARRHVSPQDQGRYKNFGNKLCFNQ